MTWSTDFCGGKSILQRRRVRIRIQLLAPTASAQHKDWQRLYGREQSASSCIKHTGIQTSPGNQHNIVFVSPAGEKHPLSLRSTTYSHSRGPVPRPAVCLRSVSRSGHRLLFLLRCDAAQTQVETGTGSSRRSGAWAADFTPLSLQVSDLGCQAFAVLFDDIDHSLCQADSEAFSSFAHAQVVVTNEVYRFLGEPPVFLFCPTGEMVESVAVENLRDELHILSPVIRVHLLSLSSFFSPFRILWFAVFTQCIKVSVPADCRRGPAAQYNSGVDRWNMHHALSRIVACVLCSFCPSTTSLYKDWDIRLTSAWAGKTQQNHSFIKLQTLLTSHQSRVVSFFITHCGNDS